MKKTYQVVFSMGTPTTEYIIKSGEQEECLKFWKALPSIEDEGWQNAHKGTNPYKEACIVEITEE